MKSFRKKSRNTLKALKTAFRIPAGMLFPKGSLGLKKEMSNVTIHTGNVVELFIYISRLVIKTINYDNRDKSDV